MKAVFTVKEWGTSPDNAHKIEDEEDLLATKEEAVIDTKEEETIDMIDLKGNKMIYLDDKGIIEITNKGIFIKEVVGTRIREITIEKGIVIGIKRKDTEIDHTLALAHPPKAAINDKIVKIKNKDREENVQEADY